LAPNLTRIIVVLEYHPKGLFERTGNLWRAQGRRARLELKHFRRHVMTQTVLHPDDVEGWLGEIRDGEVVDTGDTEDDTKAKDDTNTKDAETEDTETKEREPSSSSTRRRGQGRPSSPKGANGERQSRRQAAVKEKEESRS
jgi:hypothetical protein